MGGLTCKKCQQTLDVPPSTQKIRCLGCKAAYTVSDTIDTSDLVHYKGTKDLGLEFAKKNIAAKHLCCSSVAKLSLSIEQQIMHPHSSRSTAGRNTVTTQVQHSFVQHKAIISGQRSLERLDTPPSPPAVYKIYHLPRGRRALLCGVSYKKQKHELKGSAKDVKNMRELLLNYYNFPAESILILAEEEGYILPTRKNIEEGFKWLMRGIQCGDSLVFYFSGHGKRQRDYFADERDGFDETICPMDFQKNGMILDSCINQAIVRPLIKDVTLHAIVDSFHKGTVLDLPRVYNIAERKWEDNSPPSGAYKGTSGGQAICFSASEDYQMAADTSVFPLKKEMTGSVTIAFINAVKASLARNKDITYQGLMDYMHQSIKQADKSGGIFAGIRRKFHQRISQDILLSSTQEFDTRYKFKL